MENCWQALVEWMGVGREMKGELIESFGGMGASQ